MGNNSTAPPPPGPYSWRLDPTKCGECQSLLVRLGDAMEDNRRLIAQAQKLRAADRHLSEIIADLDQAGVPRATPDGVPVTTTWRVRQLIKQMELFAPPDPA